MANFETLNVGEWSELYVFFKILEQKLLQGCDEDLNLLNDFVTVVSVKNKQIGTESVLEYLTKTCKIELLKDGYFFTEKPLGDITNCSKNIFTTITGTHKSTFSIPKISLFLNGFGNPVRKSKASVKRDITINVLAPVTNRKTEYGFSIKSSFAGKSTLVNASSGTNFIYSVDLPVSDLSQYKTQTKTLLKKLSDKKIFFERMDSDIFKENVQLIDTQMPIVLSKMLLYYFQSKGRNSLELLNELKNENPLQLSNLETYREKFGDFLLASALGMFPKTKWNNSYDADGGMIVVKNNGDLATFYIFKQAFAQRLKDYLLNHSFFDTPSTKRHHFGYLYTENEQTKLKLNLQIRLK